MFSAVPKITLSTETIKELITTRLPKFSDCDSFNDMQVLTPMRKGQLGVYELNKYLQETLNPPQKGKAEKEFKIRNLTL